MEFLFNDNFMWCMFVCHRVLCHAFSFASLQNCQSFHPSLFFFFHRPATHSLTHSGDLLLPFLPTFYVYSFSFFIHFFPLLSVFSPLCRWTYHWERELSFNLCLILKVANFSAKCQLCTLNIYRIAIYVIAWFSNTNIHALENCLISGIFFSLFSFYASFAATFLLLPTDDLILTGMFVHPITIYFCTASIGIYSFICCYDFFRCFCCYCCWFYASNRLIVHFGKVFHGILRQSNVHHSSFVVV